MLDILVRNGLVVDGSGAPAFPADVGVEGDRIVAVGRLDGAQATTTVDAGGCIVSPGFIDMHSHADLTLAANPTADSLVCQGITTAVVGQCGFSPAPLRSDACRQMITNILAMDDLPLPWSEWSRFSGYLAHQARTGMSANIVPLVGQGVVRASVMGFGAAPADAAQMGRMRAEVAEALASGAAGISTGLIYPPGCYAQTDELAAVAAPSGAAGRFYFSHIRGEGDTLLDAIAEAIAIGRQTGAAVEIGHFKAKGESNWGKAAAAMELIDRARAEGLDVSADMYPYLAASTSLVSMLPEWAQEGGAGATLQRLADFATRRSMAVEMQSKTSFHEAHWDSVLISNSPKKKAYQGRYVADLAAEAGQTPHDWVFDALIETRLQISMITRLMSEDNLKLQLRQPWMMIGTDSFALATRGPLAEGAPHPRTFGTFPRVLGRYVREQGVLSLEEAIHKMTQLPAHKLRLDGRGSVQKGYKADLVVFDAKTIADRATYEAPQQYPAGIRLVIVNGAMVVQEGMHSGALPGMILGPH